jgi:hypothetical protein
MQPEMQGPLQLLRKLTLPLTISERIWLGLLNVKSSIRQVPICSWSGPFLKRRGKELDSSKNDQQPLYQLVRNDAVTDA